MNKNLSFSKKLLLTIMSIVLLSSIITTYLIQDKSFKSAEKNANKYLKSLTEINAFKAKEDLNKAVVISHGFATSLETFLKNDQKYTKEDILELMKGILRKNPTVFGLWIELNNGVLFNKTQNLASKNGHDKDGRFAPFVVKTGNKIDVLPGADENYPNRVWVTGSEKSGKEYITEPYFYPVNGVQTLITAISVPLYNNGQFIGTVGVDIALKRMSKNIKNIKIFENGYASLITQKGTIVGYPDLKVLGKKISEITKDERMINLPNKISRNMVTINKSFDEKTGFISQFITVPFEIGISGIKWGLTISVPVDEYLIDAIFIKWFAIIAGIISFFLIAASIAYNTRVLDRNLQIITNGLNSFFSYLNKDSDKTQSIDIKANDEFGLMAKQINENVSIIQKKFNEDSILIEEVKSVVEKVKNGKIKQIITKSSHNESLEELKVIINNMLEVLSLNVSDDLNKILVALESYKNLDFTHKIENVTGKTEQGLNTFANIINEMLVENKTTGLTLVQSSNILLENVNVLNLNSNESAVALEETAASLEEITSNISHNTENVIKMANYAKRLNDSANEGKNLAEETTTSMNEIDEQVIAINEAISVIDKIAFQTNILSLNAAVEAATAGDAGKGFAIVAQEVRNLASRSTEAANEIKDLVQNATNKTNNGKKITLRMIDGYSQLNDNISKTIDLISDVESATKEQQTGIELINDAINSLDSKTQENASISTRTKDVANETDVIAQEIVRTANEKEFIGKNNIKIKKTIT